MIWGNSRCRQRCKRRSFIPNKFFRPPEDCRVSWNLTVCTDKYRSCSDKMSKGISLFWLRTREPASSDAREVRFLYKGRPPRPDNSGQQAKPAFLRYLAAARCLQTISVKTAALVLRIPKGPGGLTRCLQSAHGTPTALRNREQLESSTPC